MSALPQLDYPQLLSSINGASSINFNPILLRKYRECIVPLITKCGDDEQHGSTVLADIAVLQALSRRVHYGKFVAESKYQSDPLGYQALIDAGDADGVMSQLTNVKVEEKVLKRARIKAATYGREPVAEEDLSQNIGKQHNSSVGNISEQGKVDPTVIETIYRDFIIPLTKGMFDFWICIIGVNVFIHTLTLLYFKILRLPTYSDGAGKCLQHNFLLIV